MTSSVLRRARLLAAPVGLLLLGWIALASPAAAHASLVSTDPADGEVVATSPDAITLTFTETVRLTDGIELLAGDGTVIPADISGSDAVVTITPTETLADGTYVVGWRVISADSHPVAGGFSFSVGAPSETTVALPTVETPHDVDLVRKTAEATRYGGLLVATGALAFGLLVARPALRRSPVARRRLLRVGFGAAALAVVGAILLVPLTAVWQAGDTLASFGSAVVDSATWTTSTGAAALVLGLALLVGAVTVRRAPELALAAAAVALGSLALVGHTRTYGPVALVLTADLAHVLVAALWLGGLVGLVVVFSAGRDVRAGDLQKAVHRFSAVALGSVAVLTVSGLVLWWRIPQTVTDLPDSSYGWHLLVKVVLVVVVIGVATFNLRHLRRSRTIDARRLRLMAEIEAGILLLVLAVTAGLITQVPRQEPVQAASAERAAITRELDLGEGRTGTLTLTPGAVGTNAAQLEVVADDGTPVSAVEPPGIAVGIEEFELGPFRSTLTEVAPGRYEGSLDLPIPGTWRIEVGVRVDRFERVTDSIDLEVKE